MSTLLIPSRSYWQKPIRGSVINWDNPLSKNLVGFYAFNELGSVPFNLVRAFPSQFIGSPLWADGSLLFDGTNDAVRTDEYFKFSNGFSISFYAKANFPSGAHILSGAGNYPSTPVNTYFRINYTAGFNFAGGTKSVDTYVYKNNEWAWYTLNYDKVTLKYLVNGIEQTSLATTATPNTSDYYEVIGQFGLYTAAQRWAGKISCGIYHDKGLTDAQIRDLIKNPYSLLSSPAVFYSVLNLSVGDSISLTENDTELIKLARLKANISESIGVSESYKAPPTPLIAKIEEVLGLLENLKVVVTPSLKSAIESISVTENIQAIIQESLFKIASEENISILENISSTLTTILIHAINNEEITVIENIQTSILTLLYKISQDESIIISESVQIAFSGIGKINPSEGISVLENISFLLTRILRDINENEDITVSDVIIAEIVGILAKINTYDLITLVESVTVELKAILLKANNSEAISIYDYPNIQSIDVSDLSINLSESITILDRIFIALDLLKNSVFDTISVSEFTKSAITPTNLSLVDSIAIAEFIKLIFPLLQSSNNDSVVVSDVVTINLPEIATHAIEIINIVENIVLLLDPLTNVSLESISISDLSFLGFYLNLQVDSSETISVTEDNSVVIRDTVAHYLRRYLGDVLSPGNPAQVEDI